MYNLIHVVKHLIISWNGAQISRISSLLLNSHEFLLLLIWKLWGKYLNRRWFYLIAKDIREIDNFKDLCILINLIIMACSFCYFHGYLLSQIWMQCTAVANCLWVLILGFSLLVKGFTCHTKIYITYYNLYIVF